MILLKNDCKFFNELKEYAKSTYGQTLIGIVGKDNYTYFSNKTIIFEEYEPEFEKRIVIGPHKLTLTNKKDIFKTEDFKEAVGYCRILGDTFKKYTDNDFLEYLAFNPTKEYESKLTYATIIHVLDSDNIEKSEIYINKTDKVDLFTNEDQSVFSVVALSDYGVDIKVQSNNIVISDKGIAYEFNGCRHKDTHLWD